MFRELLNPSVWGVVRADSAGCQAQAKAADCRPQHVMLTFLLRVVPACVEQDGAGKRRKISGTEEMNAEDKEFNRWVRRVVWH